MVQGRICGGRNDNYFKWKITVHDTETDSKQTAKYFSLRHFNDVHQTNHTPDTVQKLKKLKEKIGDYTMDDVRAATKGSVLAKFGHLHFEKIREPVKYEITRVMID
jgi:hypothetical protein